jgi:hypothetical protein
MQQNIVTTDTRLPSIEATTPNHTPSSNFDVDVFVNNRGTLATQLECHGGEMLRRSAHDNATHGAVSCVEDVVEALFEHFGALGDSPRHNLENSVVQVPVKETIRKKKKKKKKKKEVKQVKCVETHLGSSSTSNFVECSDISEGFNTTQFPAAIAVAIPTQLHE